MIDDHELLELAARAAGLSSQGDEISRYGHFMGLYIRENYDPTGYCWNPLTNDGDALRLAVKLGLVLSPSNVSAMVWLPGDVARNEVWEPLAADPYAATRRAIVRAAAELGKTKP